MLRANDSGAFALSVLLHAAVGGGIFFATWFVSRLEEKPFDPTIFQIVDPENARLGDRTEAIGAPDGPNIRFNKPKTPKPPKPTTPPRQTTPQKTAPKTAEKNAKTPPKNTKAYAEFMKEHGKTLAKNSKPNTRSTTKTAKVDTRGVQQDLDDYAEGGGTGGKENIIAARDYYLRQLFEALKSAYAGPRDLADDPAVEISFSVAPDGSLYGMKVTRSSGNKDYDAAALDAFRAVRSIGPTPSGKGFNYKVSFRMSEG